MLDPASALSLFILFQATEKVIGYAGGNISARAGDGALSVDEC